MSGPRDYSAGTRAALAALSKGTCYYPSCKTQILEFIDGEPFVNYEIAHIRDAKPGNRYDPTMTDDGRRAFANLVLLCKPHHTLVDKTHPDRFSVEDLQQWKADREGTGIEALKGLRGLTEERLEELIIETVATAGDVSRSAAVVGVAKGAAQLAASVRESRKAVALEVAKWRQTWERTRASLLAWDPDTGERLYAEPPAIETDRHRRAVAAALEAAVSGATSFVSTVRAEVAAVRATSVQLRPWCDDVLRAVEGVVEAAQRWPTPPPFEDDAVLADSLADLKHAVDALTAKWRGEDVPEPIPPEPAPETTESDEARALREHAELLEDTSHYLRAERLPYKRDLAMQLLNATTFAASIPPVPSLWPYGLDTTASLVAAVTRNADATEFGEVLDRCVAGPILEGVCVARHLQAVAELAGDATSAQRASDAVAGLLRRADWSDDRFWEEVEVYGRDLLSIDAATKTPEQTAFRLETAFRERPEILPRLIRSCAEWVEQRDIRDPSGVLGWRRRYSGLPTWLPAAAVANAIHAAYPHIAAESEPREDADQTERLAAQILYHATSST